MTVTLHLPSASSMPVVMNCSPATSLQQIIEAAVKHLLPDDSWQNPVNVEKAVEQVDSVQFAGSDPDGADVLFGLSRQGRLIVADDDFSNITIEDLTRARDAGLINGALTDVGLHCSGYRTGSLADSWAYFVGALGALKLVTDAVQVARDMRGMGGLFSRRSARRYARRFSAMGLAPRHLVRLIRRRKIWESARLALYLNISAEEAAQLLIAAGYRFTPESGCWVYQTPFGRRSTLETIVDRAEATRVLSGERDRTWLS